MPLLQCPQCKRYTLAEKCPQDSTIAIKPGPAKYSPEDHYGKYRRLAKTQARERAAAKQGP